MIIKNILPVGIGLLFMTQIIHAQTRNLYVEADGSQMGTIHSLGQAPDDVGLELIRGKESERLGDWRILNNEGQFRIQFKTDNFLSGTSSGDNLFSILEDGNTGIGCTNPWAKLTVCNGELGFSNPFSEAAADKISLDGNAFGQTDMVGLGYETSNYINQQGQSFQVGDLYYKAEGAHRWYNNENADLGLSASMVLSRDGNLGINTRTPEARLHISTGADASLSTHGYIMTGRVSGRNVIIDDNEIMTRDGGGPSVLMMQRDGGSVSIGMPSGNVEAPLAVQGDGNQFHISSAQETTNDWFLGASNPNWLIGGGKFIISTGGNSTNNMMEFDRTNDIVEIQGNGGDVLLCSNENGKVGIGISTHTNLPGEDYLLAVDGGIVAEEVLVELSGSWPDYVFQDNYDLKTIEEIEAAINELGHLPGIPSAAQLEEEGINLGVMQQKMMEKIEELTLYVIELNKENSQLVNRITQLEESK